MNDFDIIGTDQYEADAYSRYPAFSDINTRDEDLAARQSAPTEKYSPAPRSRTSISAPALAPAPALMSIPPYLAGMAGVPLELMLVLAFVVIIACIILRDLAEIRAQVRILTELMLAHRAPNNA